MGKNERMVTQLRKRLREERERRGWSQAHIAKLLSDNGIPMYATTVAKVEAGERAVRIEELAGIADLFEVSLDGLLGRNHNPAEDLAFTLQSFLDTARAASVQLSAITDSLAARSAELAAFEFEGRDTIIAGCDRVRGVLSKASDVLVATTGIKSADLQDAATNQLLTDTMRRAFPQWFDAKGRLRKGDDEA